jgi:hypothetical protein
MTGGSGPRTTLPTLVVLRAMLAEPARERCGLEICKAADLPSGTTCAPVAADPQADRGCLMTWRAVLARIRVLASALDRDGALASALDLDQTRVLDQARALTGDLVRDLDSALTSYHALRCALASYPVLDRDRDLAHCLARHSAGSLTADPEDGRSMPPMVRVAVRLLPRSWQPRRALAGTQCPPERARAQR